MAHSLVYATAQRHGATLVTGDADFAGLPGALVIRWCASAPAPLRRRRQPPAASDRRNRRSLHIAGGGDDVALREAVGTGAAWAIGVDEQGASAFEQVPVTVKPETENDSGPARPNPSTRKTITVSLGRKAIQADGSLRIQIADPTAHGVVDRRVLAGRFAAGVQTRAAAAAVVVAVVGIAQGTGTVVARAGRGR